MNATEMAMQTTVVMKFGGTSVADSERIKRAAGRIVGEARGRAPGGGGAVGARPYDRRADRGGRGRSPRTPIPREMDMLLSTGERISCALCAMAIHDLGHRAISLTGSQAGIVTDTSHTRARILDVRADRIRGGAGGGPDRPGRGIPGGFNQPRRDHAWPRWVGHNRGRGRGRARRRGLRDLHRCQQRVHRRPRIVPDAASLPVVSFEEMLEMAASGRRSAIALVKIARTHGVRLHCRSSLKTGRVPL